MLPTIGRIVHYTSPHDAREISPAIVTHVFSGGDVVNLTLFHNGWEGHATSVAFSAEPPGDELSRGKWSWPPMAPLQGMKANGAPLAGQVGSSAPDGSKPSEGSPA